MGFLSVLYNKRALITCRWLLRFIHLLGSIVRVHLLCHWLLVTGNIVRLQRETTLHCANACRCPVSSVRQVLGYFACANHRSRMFSGFSQSTLNLLSPRVVPKAVLRPLQSVRRAHPALQFSITGKLLTAIPSTYVLLLLLPLRFPQLLSLQFYK